MSTSKYDHREKRLDALLEDAGVNWFGADELGKLNPAKWRGGDFALPADHELDRIVATAQLADRIRDAWGGPLTVSSGYRPPEYNRAVGGSPRSQHIPFRALDIHPADWANFDLNRYFDVVRSVVAGARQAGWNVGLGLYYERPNGDDRFAHIDVGAETGHNRSWTLPKSHPNTALIGS